MARKKRTQAGESGGEEDVNLTPMLDVVFILLIFFIVTAQFIKEPGVEIARQDVDNDEQVKPLAILIAIDENSDIFMDKKKVEPNEVEFTIKEMREDNPKGKLVVQVDNEANAETLVGLMETIKDADGSTVINVSTAQD
ncbi:MAG: biopolymer transporter ExbD [Alphaproteobacteria bacterium]|jgi:biopolymer transport protein ExbD|nr:biopolymer transporter ExbD [Alphaproteobacteria bacterium]